MSITNGGLISSSSKAAQQDTLALSDGLACFTGSFSGVTSTSISHGLNSTDLVVEFKDSLGNLLIPDNWSITNPNVIEADFSPAATGDVTIIACIESGLAAITGGVTILEGLSGIIDLDSPNDSIDISTSGQVINLNAIFTPTSGALLEQKCRDIITLSGLIGTGGSGSPVDSRPATGVIIPDADCVYDLGAELARWSAFYACSGLFRNTVGIGTSDPQGGLHVSGLAAIIEATATANGQDLLVVSADAAGFDQVQAIHVNYQTGGFTSGLHAAVLVDVDNNDDTGGFVAAYAAIAASGEGRTIGLGVGPRIDPVLQLLAGELSLSAMTVGEVDGADELSDLQDPDILTTLFISNGDNLVIGSDAQFTEIVLDLTATAGKDLRTIFEYSTGGGFFAAFAPLDGTNGFQNAGTILWTLSDVPGWTADGGNFLIRMTRNRSGNIQGNPVAQQVSIAPLSSISVGVDAYFWNKDGVLRIKRVGVGTTTLPDTANAIETSGNIATSGHVNPLADCVYDLGTTTDRWANLNACSGTFSVRPTVNGSGVLLIGEAAAASSAAASGASIELFFTPLSGTNFVLEHNLNTNIFTWDMWSTEFDPILSIQPTTVSPSGSSHVIVELDIPGSGRLVLTAGGTGPAGPAGPSGEAGSPGPAGPSGALSTKRLLFTPSSGILFVMEHGLASEDFVWNLWSTETSLIRTVEPVNIAPSGSDHVIVELDLPMSGKLNLVMISDS